MKRRDVIKGGLLAGLAGLTGLGCAVGGSNGAAASAPVLGARRRRPVRNIIFYAYDGFNYEDLALARFFARQQGHGDLLIERMMGDGSAGSMLTHSLTSVVTDSSAASAAWSTGRKILNGAVSVYPDGRELTTILELARRAGKATGLITTTRITHATPAAWVARVAEREMEDEIAEQYLEFRPDVLLGGGREHFDATRRDDGRDLEAAFRTAGYRVVRTADELAALGRTPGSAPILGTFTEDHLPFEIDRRFQGVASPSLADMTRAGLAALDRHPDGFVVQVEAGRIDHANHDNDPGAAVWDVLAADEALAVIRDYVHRNPDTLLIMASDHATGAQGVYGYGSRYLQSSDALRTLGRARASLKHLRFQVLGEQPTAARVRAAVGDHLGIPLTDRQADDAARAMARDLRVGHRNAHNVHPYNSFYQVISQGAPRQADRPNVNFATGAHTAGLVPVFTYGAWDGPANLGVVDNTELFGWMTAALGTEFSNPVMTEAEALRLSATRPAREMAIR